MVKNHAPVLGQNLPKTAIVESTAISADFHGFQLPAPNYTNPPLNRE